MITTTESQLTRTGRRGRMIPVQPTALSRRRKKLLRGHKMAPQGRPTRHAVAPNQLTKKAFKARKPHNLSLNIERGTHNAKCH